MSKFETGIVRIRASQGLIIGVGFLFSEKRILTCCHVVDIALDQSASTEMPTGSISLDFPFTAPRRIITAKVIQWFPKQKDTGDVAVLELQGDPPEQSFPVPMVLSESLIGHSVRTFGFPSGFEEAGQVANGAVMGLLANGRLAVHGTTDFGVWIEGGFSGAPVWDNQLTGVIGMVASVDSGVNRSASVIPNTTMRQYGVAMKIIDVPVSLNAHSNPVIVTSPTQGATFNITGQNPTVINAQNIESLVIKPEDSEAERDRKASHIVDLTVSELLTILRNIDSRLGLTKTLEREDMFGQRLNEIRQKVVPSIVEIVGSSYQKLLARQQLASLRAALNTYPLPLSTNESLIQLAPEADIPVDDLQFFYTQVREVNWAMDALFGVLEEIAEADAAQADWNNYLQARLKLTLETLHNRSLLSHMVALNIISKLMSKRPNLRVSLHGMTELKPARLVDGVELANLYTQHIDEAEKLHRRRAELVERGNGLLNQSLVQYEAVENLLTISPDDTWDVVIGKAVSLRQFGRTEDAIKAFSKYKTMFQATDPHAAKYADIAENFTAAFEHLGLKDGAIYVFDVADDSPAAKAGLQTGDVITYFGDSLVSNMVVMQKQLEKLMNGQKIVIRGLRINNQSKFEAITLELMVKKPLGISLMPI